MNMVPGTKEKAWQNSSVKFRLARYRPVYDPKATVKSRNVEDLTTEDKVVTAINTALDGGL